MLQSYRNDILMWYDKNASISSKLYLSLLSWMFMHIRPTGVLCSPQDVMYRLANSRSHEKWAKKNNMLIIATFHLSNYASFFCSYGALLQAKCSFGPLLVKTTWQKTQMGTLIPVFLLCALYFSLNQASKSGACIDTVLLCCLTGPGRRLPLDLKNNQ